MASLEVLRGEYLIFRVTTLCVGLYFFNHTPPPPLDLPFLYFSCIHCFFIVLHSSLIPYFPVSHQDWVGNHGKPERFRSGKQKFADSILWPLLLLRLPRTPEDYWVHWLSVQCPRHRHSPLPSPDCLHVHVWHFLSLSLSLGNFKVVNAEGLESQVQLDTSPSCFSLCGITSKSALNAKIWNGFHDRRGAAS